MSHSEKFVSRKSNSEVLSKHIAYYYFHESNEKGFVKKFIYYPNYKLALTTYRGIDIQFKKAHFTITPNKKLGFTQFYGGIQTNCMLTEIHAPFTKVGVVFHPLGLNYFLNAPLSEISIDNYGAFEYFMPSMQECLEEAYKTDEVDSKVKLLDAFFLSQYSELNEHRIESAIRILKTVDEKLSVNELAEKMQVSRRTLLRLFKQHLNCSIKDYINIIQFRKALEHFQSNKSKPSLTNLAHQVNYYDQSEFIHHIKKITGTTPKQFFASIGQLGQEDTFVTSIK